jgi:hypothetical protein
MPWNACLSVTRSPIAQTQSVSDSSRLQVFIVSHPKLLGPLVHASHAFFSFEHWKRAPFHPVDCSSGCRHSHQRGIELRHQQPLGLRRCSLYSHCFTQRPRHTSQRNLTPFAPQRVIPRTRHPIRIAECRTERMGAVSRAASPVMLFEVSGPKGE